MIKLGGIYTIRNTPQQYYWDVVFEWEDEFAKVLNLPLVPVGTKFDEIYKPSPLKKILNRIAYYKTRDKFFFNPTVYYLAFHIGPPGVYSFHSRKDVIPIVIDFWKSEDLKRFESIFSLSKTVFVTSKEVFNYLLDKRLSLNLNHLSLSIPDKMLSSRNFPKKRFDLIQVGRQNKLLTEYVELLLKEYPEINYVYSERIDEKIIMKSTRSGTIGEFSTRESFLELLKQAKVALVSAPGMDEDRLRTGGFSPVTPRFFECAACGCYLVGIYPDNDDFVFYGINKICKNVSDYAQFKKEVLSCLDREEVPSYRDFLRNHLTSKKAEELLEKLC